MNGALLYGHDLVISVWQELPGLIVCGNMQTFNEQVRSDQWFESKIGINSYIKNTMLIRLPLLILSLSEPAAGAYHRGGTLAS